MIFDDEEYKYKFRVSWFVFPRIVAVLHSRLLKKEKLDVSRFHPAPPPGKADFAAPGGIDLSTL